MHSSRCDDTYLAGALGAAIHRPFILVFVHHAVVDANSCVDVYLSFQLITVLRLGEKREREREKGVAQDGKLSLCQSSNTDESLTNTMIKTLLDSSEAVQMQPTAKRICVFTWVSLRTWPGTAITATSDYALGMH